MVTIHAAKTPYQRDLFGISEAEVRNKFENWQEHAHYTIELTILLQIDTTNVSAGEYSVAPNITFLSVNQAIINIYKSIHFDGSFQEFQSWYASYESSLQSYINHLLTDLNSCRSTAGLSGNWYINYGLDDRKIYVSKARKV